MPIAALLLSGAAPSYRGVPLSVSEREYETSMGLNEVVPQIPRRNAPVVVLIHGCCGDRRDLEVLARALARRGTVVLQPDVHRFGAGGGWPASYRDVVCAVSDAERVARGLRGRHPVVLVGWSDGALIGAAVALGWSVLAPSSTDCVTPVGHKGPDVFVGLAGHYGWPGVTPPNDLITPATISWFGATPERDPTAWRLGNPQWWLSQPGARAAPPFHLIAGRDDPATAEFASALTEAGTVVTVHRTPNGSGLALSQPRDVIGNIALRELCGVLGLPADP